MSCLLSNFAPFAVAAASAVVVWMFGGTRGGLLVPVVPWLVAILLETLFFFPQRREDETSYDARERVWHDLKRDPLTWVALGLFVLLLVPFVNNGLCPSCDAGRIASGLSEKPPVPLIPFCVDRIDHLNVVLWFALALSSLVVVRHALTRRGKRLVLELLVWNGVGLAALGFLQNALGAEGPFWNTNAGTVYGAGFHGDFFSVFGYPNMGGDYFTTLFGISLALWRHNLEERRAAHEAKDISSSAEPPHRQFWAKHYFLIPAVVCFYAALNTLSRAAILLATSTAVVYFLHSFVSFVAHKRKADRVRAAAWTALGVAVVVTLACLFSPKGVQKELGTIGTTEVFDRVSGRGQYHVRVATEIWKDHPLCGCGGWGYIHFCVPKMTPEERADIQVIGGINVHNDYLQFLAEHGVLGFGAMVALVVLLVWPVCRLWRRLSREARFLTGRNAPPRPRQIFVLPAPAFFILVTACATLIHAFADCPFRSPAVLTLFYVSLAAIPGFLPRPR
jgi:O-antigen ligase